MLFSKSLKGGATDARAFGGSDLCAPDLGGKISEPIVSWKVGRSNQDENYDLEEYGIFHFLLCLTLKMSHGGKWRDFLRSRNRDTYRSWLHRLVRLIFHFRLGIL
jgi:hypothetical protein